MWRWKAALPAMNAEAEPTQNAIVWVSNDGEHERNLALFAESDPLKPIRMRFVEMKHRFNRLSPCLWDMNEDEISWFAKAWIEFARTISPHIERRPVLNCDVWHNNSNEHGHE